MNNTLQLIPLTSLMLGFIPSVALIVIMYRWRLNALGGVWANARMLAQLLAIGYVLTFIFEAENSIIIVAVLSLMIGVSAWIAIRPLPAHSIRVYAVMLAALAAIGLPVFSLVTQLILDLPRWFEPSVVVPIGGMIFANAMNTASLAAERFHSETQRGVELTPARRAALDAALIPQMNALLAVGLVSLPGMMTGQILSGTDPLIAARYQIVVMCMIFGSGGLSAALYLVLAKAAPTTNE